jgi:DNA modification methylase
VIKNHITWSKKRGIGTQFNYLYTREELLFLVKGKKDQKPSVFNVPYLNDLRGYEGYNKQYPALSPYKRRTNIWSDVTEILRNKKHVAEKPVSLIEIPIAASSNVGDWVIDPFSGSGSSAAAARKLDRRWIMFENDQASFDAIVERMS